MMSQALDRAGRQQAAQEALILSDKWRTPIIADLVLGTIVFIVGVVLSIAWQPVLGGGIGALGLLYDALAVRRWKLWSQIRADATADTDE